MADVRPFRGVRFDRRYVGPIGPLIAPPYDVLDVARRVNEFSVGLVENVEVGSAGDQHALAAARYRSWRRQGILRQDDTPAFYLHRQTFTHNGSETVRTGLIARVRLTDWSKRVVLPHERTTEGPRTERLHRLRSVGANLSPLYLLFRDPSGELHDLVSGDAARDMPFDDQDLTGGRHQLVALTSPTLHKQIVKLFEDRTLMVADGHHRYEAALAYRNERRRRSGANRDYASEFVMVLLAAAEDHGVLIRPIHRVVESGGDFRVKLLVEFLHQWFAPRSAAGELNACRDADFLFRVVLADGTGCWDVYTKPENSHLTLMPADKGAAWRALPISALQLTLQRAASPISTEKVSDIRLALDAEEAVQIVQRGEAQAAFLLPPPSLEQVLGVAEEGDLMPAKSTWFEPKAPAGLVINELGSELSPMQLADSLGAAGQSDVGS